MKKTAVFLMLFLCISSLKAQSYIGFLTDNYSGVHSVINNPANIVDSRYKVDINLVGVSTFAGNDFYGVKLGDLFDNDFDFEDDAKSSLKDSNNFLANLDILGPSFMFNINENNSIAIFTRARSFVNINGVNGVVVENLSDDIDFEVNDENVFGSANLWAEIGVSYARVLMNKEQHFLKGGITLKYLQGFGNAYARGENISVDYNFNTLDPNNGTVQTTGEAGYGYSDNLEDIDNIDNVEVISGANGIGVDLGFTYEWRPDYKNYTSTDSKGNEYMPRDVNKYKVRIGLSLTDFGSISYKGTEEIYNFNNTLTVNDFEDIEIDELENFYTALAPQEVEKAVLPTAIHTNVDWNFYKKFYLNLNADLSLTSAKKVNRNRIANTVSLTPRLETKWFSFYSPISFLQHSGFQWGAGLRAGPLYIGSGSVLSLLISDNSKAADVYMGLKVPVYQSRPKDKDGDGVLDKVDECPETKGPEANYGCPWPDTDGDGILDKDDNCPEEVGELENNGCPWLDTDTDGVLDKDDNCPQEAGPVENQGCPYPDTDNDGVLDKDDQCVDIPGTVANSGCPEVTEEVQKNLNQYAKTILFNSGKSSIKEESNSVLIDIVKILNEYPTSTFTVEGHTDSAGSAKSNQRLSDARANAVKNFLVENGIDKFRLSAQGFGEDRPIASNKTRTGRAKNRRVEINLVK